MSQFRAVFLSSDSSNSVLLNHNIQIQGITIETALEPFKEKIDNFENLIAKYKVADQQETNKLSVDELAAIKIYFTNDQNNVAEILNAAIDSRNQSEIEPWKKFYSLLVKGLERLETTRETLWTILSKTIENSLELNQIYRSGNIISCRFDEKEIRSILTENDILCQIKSISGKDLRGFFGDETKIPAVILPGATFHLKSRGEVFEFLETSEVDEAENSPQTKVESLSTSTQSESEDAIPNFSCPTNVDAEPDKMMVSELQTDEQNSSLCDKNIQMGNTFSTEKTYEVEPMQIGEEVEADQMKKIRGIRIISDNEVYIGGLENDKKNGFGVFYRQDKIIVVGQWKNGNVENERNFQNLLEIDIRSPIQKHDDDNGNIYIGQTKGDQAHGYGVRIWSDGSRYEGQFQNDKKNGFGIYFYTENDYYIGHWENDDIEGPGFLQWATGESYHGNFLHGKRDGQGCYRKDQTILLEGSWSKDLFIIKV